MESSKSSNGSLQRLRRVLVATLATHVGAVTRDNVMPVIVSSFYSAFNQPAIFSAVRQVGFVYDGLNTEKILLNKEQINYATTHHSKTYVISKKKKRILLFT